VTPSRVALAAALAAGLVAGAPQARAGTPAEAFAKLARDAEAAKQAALPGADGWIFLTAELRHLGIARFWGADAAQAGRAPKPEWRDPLPAIVDFREQLAKAGIELVVVPVPPKAAIVPAEVKGLGSTPPSARPASRCSMRSPRSRTPAARRTARPTATGAEPASTSSPRASRSA